MTERPTNSAYRDGRHIVVRIHEDNVQSIRVALSPCGCSASKSSATAKVKADLKSAIVQASLRKFDGARGSRG